MKNIATTLNEFLHESKTNNDETFDKIVELLLEYDFKKTTIPNTLKRGVRYTAVIGKMNNIIITRYTPKYGRYLDTKECENIDELEKYLKRCL